MRRTPLVLGFSSLENALAKAEKTSMWYGLFFLILIAASPSFAQNSSVASIWNQYQLGQYCSQVTDNDFRKSDLGCGLEESQKYARMKGSAADVIEKLIYDRAAEKQIKRDQCMNEQLSAISKSDAKRWQWTQMATQAWLGLKKSRLILEKCDREFLQPLAAVRVNRLGLEKAFDAVQELRKKKGLSTVPKEVADEWRKICLDSEKLQALQAVDSLFAASLPFANSPEVFETIEKARANLINKNTGEPLTDAEILSMNLRDLSGIRVPDRKNFSLEAKAGLDGLLNKRKAVVDELQKAKKNGSYELGHSQKQYLREDGMTHEALEEAGLLTLDANGKLPTAGACFLARNEPTFGGEIANLAAMSIVGGGVIGGTLKGLTFSKRIKAMHDLGRGGRVTRYGLSKVNEYRELRGVAAAGKAGKQGFLTVGLSYLPDAMIRECASSARRTPKLQDAAKSDLEISDKSAGLPSDLAYTRWSMKVDPKDTPSCPANAPDLVPNTEMDPHCIREVLLTVLPMTAALPVMVGAGL